MNLSGKEYPYTVPLLENCETELNGLSLFIRVQRGGVDLLKAWADKVSELVKQWYGKG